MRPSTGAQAFVPGRMATLADWLADIAGAALAVVAINLWLRSDMEGRIESLLRRSP